MNLSEELQTGNIQGTSGKFWLMAFQHVSDQAN